MKAVTGGVAIGVLAMAANAHAATCPADCWQIVNAQDTVVPLAAK